MQKKVGCCNPDKAILQFLQFGYWKVTLRARGQAVERRQQAEVLHKIRTAVEHQRPQLPADHPTVRKVPQQRMVSLSQTALEYSDPIQLAHFFALQVVAVFAAVSTSRIRAKEVWRTC